MNDLYAGCIAGIAQTIIGHPLDTIKVLYQNKSTLNDLKIRTFYRGWNYPMVSGCFFNSIVFPIYEVSYKKTKNSFISGAMSGTVVSPFVYLFDIGKIKRQVNQHVQIKDFYRTRGLTMTFNREILAMGLYFGSYFKCKDIGISPFFSGGIAGLVNWTFTYPLDVIRTRQMARNITIREALKERQLWRGYTICAIRAITVNAVCFKTYEVFKKYFETTY